MNMDIGMIRAYRYIQVDRTKSNNSQTRRPKLAWYSNLRFSFSDCKAPNESLTPKKDTLTVVISKFAMPKNLSPK